MHEDLSTSEAGEGVWFGDLRPGHVVRLQTDAAIYHCVVLSEQDQADLTYLWYNDCYGDRPEYIPPQMPVWVRVQREVISPDLLDEIDDVSPGVFLSGEPFCLTGYCRSVQRWPGHGPAPDDDAGEGQFLVGECAWLQAYGEPADDRGRLVTGPIRALSVIYDPAEV